MQIDSEKLLLASKEDIIGWVDETTAQNSSVDFFRPEEMEPNKNPVLIQAKEHNKLFRLNDARRVRLQAFLVPVAMFLPSLLGFIFKVDPVLIATEFTFGIVAILFYFLFVGRVARWRKKKFETQLDVSDKATAAVVDKRATQWARSRYRLARGDIMFSDFYEFKLENGEVYRWDEKNPGEFVVVRSNDGKEPELKIKA